MRVQPRPEQGLLRPVRGRRPLLQDALAPLIHHSFRDAPRQGEQKKQLILQFIVPVTAITCCCYIYCNLLLLLLQFIVAVIAIYCCCYCNLLLLLLQLNATCSNLLLFSTIYCFLLQ